MPVDKKKGQGSQKKVTGSTTTRSKAKQQRQQHEIDSLASLSSPVTSCKPKKLSTVSKDQKQATFNSPEQEQETIAQVVAATKQNKKSSNKEEHSTDSDLYNLPATQVKMTTPFDSKLGHLLTNYFSATGDQHDTRQMFI